MAIEVARTLAIPWFPSALRVGPVNTVVIQHASIVLCAHRCQLLPLANVTNPRFLAKGVGEAGGGRTRALDRHLRCPLVRIYGAIRFLPAHSYALWPA